MGRGVWVWLGAVAALAVIVAPVRADGEDWGIQLSRSAYWIGWGVPGLMELFGSASTHEAARHVIDAEVGAGVINAGLKLVFRQPRPSNPTGTGGMPSGQAALAFAAATSLGDQYSEWRVPLFIWAAGVGWGRHRVGAHYWHQVIAGSIVGFTVAKISDHSDDGVCDGLFFDEDKRRSLVGEVGEDLPALPRKGTTLWEWKMDF